MPVSPTRAESVEAIQVASDEFRTQLFSKSGIAWYRKQADDCREKVAHGPGLDSLPCFLGPSRPENYYSHGSGHQRGDKDRDLGGCIIFSVGKGLGRDK